MADTTPVSGLRATGKPPTPVDVTGKFVAFQNVGTPATVRMPDSNALYLPVFSEEPALQAMMKRIGIPVVQVSTIIDAREFLLSVPTKDPDGRPLHVIIDPWFTPEGKVRFMMLFRD